MITFYESRRLFNSPSAEGSAHTEDLDHKESQTSSLNDKFQINEFSIKNTLSALEKAGDRFSKECLPASVAVQQLSSVTDHYASQIACLPNPDALQHLLALNTNPNSSVKTEVLNLFR